MLSRKVKASKRHRSFCLGEGIWPRPTKKKGGGSACSFQAPVGSAALNRVRLEQTGGTQVYCWREPSEGAAQSADPAAGDRGRDDTEGPAPAGFGGRKIEGGKPNTKPTCQPPKPVLSFRWQTSTGRGAGRTRSEQTAPLTTLHSRRELKPQIKARFVTTGASFCSAPPATLLVCL